jgi:hypothetical protein
MAKEMGLDCRPIGGEGSGEDTPSESESSGEDDEEGDEDGEEGEVTPPPHSLPREALPLLGGLFDRQAGITFSVCRLKQTWTETVPSTDSPPQPHLTLVLPDSQG